MNLEKRIKKVKDLCKNLDGSKIQNVYHDLIDKSIVKVEWPWDGVGEYHDLRDSNSYESLIAYLKTIQKEKKIKKVKKKTKSLYLSKRNVEYLDSVNLYDNLSLTLNELITIFKTIKINDYPATNYNVHKINKMDGVNAGSDLKIRKSFYLGIPQIDFVNSNLIFGNVSLTVNEILNELRYIAASGKAGEYGESMQCKITPTLI